MTLASLLSHWKSDADTAPNFAAWRILPPRPAELVPLPPLPPPLPAAAKQANSPTVLIGRDLIAALPSDVRAAYTAVPVPGTSPA